jgi:hypothetical protein
MRPVNIFIAISIFLTSCSKEYHEFVKVTIDQGGESVILRGYLPNPTTTTWVYLVEVTECGLPVMREVRVEAGEVYGESHYQTNCKVGGIKIVYDDILRQ